MHEPLHRALTHVGGAGALTRVSEALAWITVSWTSAGPRDPLTVIVAVSACALYLSGVRMEDICPSDDARATAELEGRWALVGGAWDASQPAVRNGRDSQLEKKVGVSWRCLG